MTCYLYLILCTWDAVITCTPVTVFFSLGVRLCTTKKIFPIQSNNMLQANGIFSRKLLCSTSDVQEKSSYDNQIMEAKSIVFSYHNVLSAGGTIAIVKH